MKKLIISTFVATLLMSTSVFAETTATTTDLKISQTEPVPTLISAPVSGATYNSKTISTTDYATIKVTPDTATVNISIETLAPTSAEGKAKNEETYKNMVNSLVNQGLAKKEDFTMTDFYAFPDYTYNEAGEQINNGYRVYNNVALKVTDLSKLDKAINEIIKFNDARVNYTSFSTSKYDEYYNQALIKAIKNATNRAQYISDQIFDGKPVEIIQVSDSYQGNNLYYSNDAMAKTESAVAGGDITYVPQTIDVTAYAQVLFTTK